MKEFIGFLHDFDHSLLFKVNHEWVTPIFDRIFIFLTTPKDAIYFVVLLFAYVFIRKPNRAITILLGCALAAGMADSTATYLIKRNFPRDRPEFSAQNVRLIVPSQGSPGFPSNHSANCFAVATFIGSALPELFVVAYIVAAAVAYSRVYVGVHYPLDVIGGAFLGYLSGVLAIVIMTMLSEGGEIPDAPSQPKQWRPRHPRLRNRD